VIILLDEPGDRQQALTAYVNLHISILHIHPFFDGNGRLARLVANIPALMTGLPPIIIPREHRKAYIDALSAYHFAVIQIRADDELVPESENLQPFIDFCGAAWQATMELVDEVRKRQQARLK
jgi:Fic family protein